MNDQKCPNEPKRRNKYGEPICDNCGMVVIDRQNSDFGGECVCFECRKQFEKELEQIQQNPEF